VAAEDTNGRGLVLVESLADDWGVCPHESGKSVWFELGGRAA
ncbi:ATP-binding protein, partial [Streptomyces sp. SID625]|nr:ATP-binding protein [Streptomyces sp. SID625]